MANVTIHIDDTEATVLVQQPLVTIALPTSLPGPTGPPGPAGGQTVTKPAGENLNAGRAVVVDGGDVYHFQPTDPTHAGRMFGITTTSALSGANVDVQVAGLVTDAAFAGLTDAVCWVTTNGVVTATRPTSGVVQKVGVGVGSNMVLLDFSIQIIQT